MFSPELEKLIEITLADGVLTDQEKSVLIKKANEEGVDIDQLDVYIQYLLQQRKEEEIKKAEAKKANETMGNVKKCPMCGAAYVMGSLVCECGHIFEVTVQSNAYVKFTEEVQKKVSAIKSPDQLDPLRAFGQQFAKSFATSSSEIVSIQHFISSYPVPNNRIDLLEFLVNLQSVANPNAPKESLNKLTHAENLDFGYYYWELFTSCINKAKVYFSGDKDFQSSFQFFEEKTAKPKGLFAKLFGK